MYCIKLIKWFILFLCLLSFNPTFAVLDVEIRGGFQSAAPIAIAPFSWTQSGAVPVDIARIIRTDLARSGVFVPLANNQLPEHPTMTSAIKLSRWQNTQAENLVVGQITRAHQGNFTVEFKMLDIYTGKTSFKYRYNVKDKHLRRVAHQISDQIYQQLMHTKGAFDTLIAYVVVNNNVNINKRVYTLAVSDSDGYAEQIVLRSKKPILSPAWSPDGQQLAYVSFEKDHSVVYIQQLKSGQRKIIAQYKGINSAPAWSPDGQRLAITLSKDGNSEIYIVHISSGVLQRITNHYGIDTEASWSPDGRSLVFTSNRSGKAQIYQISVNQQGRLGKAKRITYSGQYNAGASFSPDGQFLIFITKNKKDFRVGYLDLNTRKTQLLTQSRLDESPTFSPNGKMVLYATELRGRDILEAVSVDSHHLPQRLRILSGNVREPAWSPYRSQ